MFNFKSSMVYLGALVLPLSAIPVATNNANLGKPNQKLLYKYNGQIYEDTNNILRQFLLDNPDFMSFVVVIGDLEKASADYDRGLVNKYLLPDYDLNKIKAVYQKPSGEYTTDFDEAKSAMVNPAFTRTMLTDGFGSYFSLKDSKAAIDSFKAKIATGTMGVIDFDTFSDRAKYYNPLSQADFKQLKANTEKQILDLPNQVTQNNDYSHEWYIENKAITTFNDLFDGSEDQLTQLLDTSFEEYNQMRNIYSKANGYYLTDENREFRDVQGQDIYANNNESLINYAPNTENQDFDLANFKLVTTDSDVEKYRQDLEVTKNLKIQEQVAFNNNKNDLMWEEQAKGAFIDKKNVARPISKTFYNFNGAKKEGHEIYKPRNYTFRYKLQQSSPLMNISTYQTIASKYHSIYVDDNGPTENFNFSMNNISNDFFPLTDRTKSLRFNVSLYDSYNNYRGIDYDVFYINLLSDIPWPSNAKNKEVKINNLNWRVEYDPTNVEGNWHDHKADVHRAAVQIKSLSFNLEYRYDVWNETKVDVRYGKTFLNTSELEELKSQSDAKQSQTLQNHFGNSNFFEYRNNIKNYYEPITANTNKYYISGLDFIENSNNTYAMKVTLGVKDSNSTPSRHYLKQNTFIIPIEIIEDFDQSIDNLTVRQLTLSDIAFERLGMPNQKFLSNNLNGFDDQLTLRENGTTKIIFSYQQFKDLIDYLKNNLDQKLYFWNSASQTINLNKGNKVLQTEDVWCWNWSMLPKGFISLMDNEAQIKDKNNLRLTIDFNNIDLNGSASKISNINFKWSLEKEYLQYKNPATKLPATKNINEIKSTSLKTDGFYDALIEMASELKILIDEQKKQGNLHPFLAFIDQLNYQSYQELVTETLNLNNQVLWEIKRIDQNGQFKELEYANQEIYTLDQFLNVLKSDTPKEIEIVNKVKEGIEEKDYLKMAKYVGQIKLNQPANNLEKLAYNYFLTLRSYMNTNNVANNLPRQEKYYFPDLKHLFIANLPVLETSYIIANEYQFNGSLLNLNKQETIDRVYSKEESEELIAIKNLIKDNFIPPRVVQIYDIDGNEFSNKNSNDGEELAILNAQNIANPQIVKNYVYYEGQSQLVLNQKSNIYSVKLLEQDITYYFRDYDSAIGFVQEYMMQFVQIISTEVL